MEMIGGASRVPWVKERLPVVLTATETRNMYVSGKKNILYISLHINIVFVNLYRIFKATNGFVYRS